MKKSHAIDVVLLPPEEVMSLCHEMNSSLWSQTHDGFRFDETHLPHISLVQQYVQQAALRDIVSVITSTVAATQALSLSATHTGSATIDGGLTVSGLEFGTSPELLRLHQSLMTALEPFVSTGDETAWYRDLGEHIRPGSLRWLKNYRRPNRQFHPHITLGVGPAPTLNQPLRFTVDRLALCHLGNFNTCRKILDEWRLKP